MIVNDLFELANGLIDQIGYMTENYEEVDPSLDDIPSETLDDIIDDIKRENPEEPEEEPSDEVMDDDPTPDPEPEPEPTPEPTPEPDPEPEPEPEPEVPGKMDPYIDMCNIIITQLNAQKNNAIFDGIMDIDVLSSQNSVVRCCMSVTDLIHKLYVLAADVRAIYNSPDNINHRSIFILRSFYALKDITNVIEAIYNELNSRKYLKAINGPVQKDYDHWMNVEVPFYLSSLDVWMDADDESKLGLIDESVQLVLKYSALLKKLVISEFKGFDDYYEQLIDYIITVNYILDYYDVPSENNGTGSSISYDPGILVKLNKLTSTIRGYTPAIEDDENE